MCLAYDKACPVVCLKATAAAARVQPRSDVGQFGDLSTSPSMISYSPDVGFAEASSPQNGVVPTAASRVRNLQVAAKGPTPPCHGTWARGVLGLSNASTPRGQVARMASHPHRLALPADLEEGVDGSHSEVPHERRTFFGNVRRCNAYLPPHDLFGPSINEGA